jgi:hypothetical protein
MSYCGHLDFGIVADREQMRDVWNLIPWLGEALDELRPAGHSPGAAAGVAEVPQPQPPVS